MNEKQLARYLCAVRKRLALPKDMKDRVMDDLRSSINERREAGQTDEEILAAQKLLGRTCGVFGEPAGVTGTAAVKKACELGLIEKGATVVSVVTGNGLKDVANAIKSAGEPINLKPDLDLMVEEFAKRGVTVE